MKHRLEKYVYRKCEFMEDKKYRHVIKSHVNIVTVSKVMDNIYKKYEQTGYRMLKRVINAFTYRNEEGEVYIVYWENGVVYEKRIEKPHPNS